MEIKDKVIIVTGASRGIGLAIARHLSSLGGKVVLAARSSEIIKELEKELPGSLAITTDMTKPLDIKNMVNKAVDKYGRIDILVNNAGLGMYGLLENMKLEDFKRIMELNVYGVVRAMQEVIPIMRKQGGGMIVNISSAVTKRYISNMSAYSATKYAINALSLIARQELEKDKIIVSIILPKITATDFGKNAIGGRPAWNPNQPVPQIDNPEKVAEKVAEIIKSEEAEILV